YFEAAEAKVREVVLEKVGGALRNMSEGDLSTPMEPLTGAFAQLYEDFERMRVNVNSALAKVSETARNVGLGSSEIRQASDDLARRTEQ
ncbi:hypothetical protein ACI394_28795, partial [Klebsiella pneumoniae]